MSYKDLTKKEVNNMYCEKCYIGQPFKGNNVIGIWISLCPNCMHDYRENETQLPVKKYNVNIPQQTVNTTLRASSPADTNEAWFNEFINSITRAKQAYMEIQDHDKHVIAILDCLLANETIA